MTPGSRKHAEGPGPLGTMSSQARLPVWISLCLSRFPMLLKIRPQISQGWMYLKADTGSGWHTALADGHKEYTCISAFISRCGRKKKRCYGGVKGPETLASI